MLRLLIISLFIFLISACGGGGSSTTVPEAVSANVTGTPVKGLEFSWTDVDGATSYKLLEDPDGVSGYTQVGNDIDSGIEVYTHIIPLYQRVNARYIVQSCNSAGCSDSAAMMIDNTIVNNAIGYIKASNTDAFDQFGRSVSLSSDGTTLAVSARLEDSAAAGVNGDQNNGTGITDDSGAVYVFRFNGSDWAQQAYIKASNIDEVDRFGSALSLASDGNTLAVGAYNEDSPSTGINGDENNGTGTTNDSGAVYVFRFNGSAWEQQAYIKASNTEASDQFGYAVSLSSDGNTLAVGARYEDSAATGVNGDEGNGLGATNNSGAVYVFGFNGSAWAQQAYIKASNPDEFDNFGSAVSLSNNGNTLAVGALGEDSAAIGVNGDQSNGTGATESSGAVYLFGFNGSAWSQQAYIKASNTEAFDQFGRSVSLSSDGNTLAAGATGEDSAATGVNGDEGNGTSDGSGAVYLFRFNGSAWEQQAYIKASNTEADDQFGYAVSLSSDGNTLAVGARYEDSAAIGVNGDGGNDTGATTFSGAVYLFGFNGSAWAQQAYIKASNTDADDTFGFAVSLSGDGNTLAVGALGEDSAAIGVNGDQSNDTGATDSSGAVYLY